MPPVRDQLLRHVTSASPLGMNLTPITSMPESATPMLKSLMSVPVSIPSVDEYRRARDWALRMPSVFCRFTGSISYTNEPFLSSV